MLHRRIEGFNLAMLPHQTVDTVKSEHKRLLGLAEEMEREGHEAEIDKVERENEEKMEELKTKRLAARSRRKQMKSDGMPMPKRKKPTGPPANVRRIR